MTKRRRSAHAEFEAWARRATQGVVSSHVYLGLKLPTFDHDALVKDPEVALQLGAAILLGRPIVFVMEDGTNIPPALQRVAAALETYTPGDEASLKRATIRALTKAGALEGIKQ